MPFLNRFALLLPLLASSACAATTLHYFRHPSCNAGTDIGQYGNLDPLTSDTACHEAPDSTVALYIDGIDNGCARKTPLPKPPPTTY